jgi:hypothetical protein
MQPRKHEKNEEHEEDTNTKTLKNTKQHTKNIPACERQGMKSRHEVHEKEKEEVFFVIFVGLRVFVVPAGFWSVCCDDLGLCAVMIT